MLSHSPGVRSASARGCVTPEQLRRNFFRSFFSRRFLHRPEHLPENETARSSGGPLSTWSLEKNWSGRRGSNPRPRPWQGRALPLSYTRIRVWRRSHADNGRAMPNAAPECNSPCDAARRPELPVCARSTGESVENGREIGGNRVRNVGLRLRAVPPIANLAIKRQLGLEGANDTANPQASGEDSRDDS